MTYKVAIIGPPGVITGFSALGAEPFAASSPQEAHDALAQLVAQTNSDDGEKYAVVMVIEDLLRGIPDKDYAALTKNVLPSVVAVPGVEGSRGYMTQKLKEYTIRAIGSDIM